VRTTARKRRRGQLESGELDFFRRRGNTVFAIGTTLAARNSRLAAETSIAPEDERRARYEMPKKNQKVKTLAARRYRDAVTGRYVTKKYAKKNRATTRKERGPVFRSLYEA
jgi:hypothetical protein